MTRRKGEITRAAILSANIHKRKSGADGWSQRQGA
jgi:hypothetical protein